MWPIRPTKAIAILTENLKDSIVRELNTKTNVGPKAIKPHQGKSNEVPCIRKPKAWQNSKKGCSRKR
jgi:hypothetical protein